MKKNPLFVDSTRMRGDMILTQVELSQVSANVDEIRMIIKKVGTEEIAVSVPLFKSIDDPTLWKGLVRLDHQEEIRYHFEALSSGTVLIETDQKEAFASYLLQDSLPSIEALKPVEENLVPVAADLPKCFERSQSSIIEGPIIAAAIALQSRGLD